MADDLICLKVRKGGASVHSVIFSSVDRCLVSVSFLQACIRDLLSRNKGLRVTGNVISNTLVNVYVDLLVFTRIAGTS